MLKGNWLLLRSALTRPRQQVLNPQPQQETHGAEALDLARTLAFDATAQQALERARLVVPKDMLEARAFWINLYNALTLHGIHQSGAKRTVLEVPGFFRRFAYHVRWANQDFTLNLDEIEHGILRDNRAPILSSPVFKPNDPRLALRLPLDPRIHFALNCGAYSCPPIRAYTGKHLEQQLDLATRSYLQDARVERGVVILPRLLNWYARDVGHPLGFARKYRPDLPANARVRFDGYDWTLERT